MIETGYHAVSTPTTAFVTDPAEIRNSNNAGRTGSAQILVGGRNSSKPLFIGIATKADVLRYLNGAPYEQVSDIDVSNNFRLTTKRIPGTTQPAAPGDQSIWLAQASGQAPQMQWSITSGDYQVVVMNADASPGVALDARAGLKIKGLFGIALGATIFGGLLALLGLGFDDLGHRRQAHARAGTGRWVSRRVPAGYPPAYPPASYPPGDGCDRRRSVSAATGFGAAATTGRHATAAGFGAAATTGRNAAAAVDHAPTTSRTVSRSATEEPSGIMRAPRSTSGRRGSASRRTGRHPRPASRSPGRRARAA